LAVGEGEVRKMMVLRSALMAVLTGLVFGAGMSFAGAMPEVDHEEVLMDMVLHGDALEAKEDFLEEHDEFLEDLDELKMEFKEEKMGLKDDLMEEKMDFLEELEEEMAEEEEED
jgi:hypothetical protein